MLSGTTILSPSRVIARHFAALRWEDLAPATAHATRRALLDAIGVMLGATGLAPECRPFRDQALADGGAGPSLLLLGRGRTTPAAAALGNGALAHALDFGDTFDAGPAHPSAALVPALLALADADSSIDGGRFLAAMAAGSDLACRLSLAPARRFEEGGWYPPPLVGMVGAAAACAKLLGLSEDGILAAMGLVLCQASFPGEIKHDPDTRLRAVREAFAARAAVSAALLAQRGVRGFEAPLEGKGGFFAVYGGGLNSEILLADLGTRFVGDEVSFKPWPCCRGTHAYIEAALMIRERIGGAVDEIESIEAEIGPVQAMLIEPLDKKARPGSAIEAKFSIPFTVATALATGAVGLDSFGHDSLQDEAILRLAARVTARPSESAASFSPAAGALTVGLASGERHHVAVAQAAGHPDHPVSDAALIDKFVACAARADSPIAGERAKAIAERLLALGPDVAAASWSR